MTTAALLEVENLTVRYPGQLAVDAVSLAAKRGEILALLGENGSGKSTLIKALAGLAPAAAGTRACVDGQELALGDPRSADRLGLRFVHQDLGLVGEFSVVDNLALGRGYRNVRAGAIDWTAERRVARIAMERLGYPVDVRAPANDLSVSERTAIAVARALSHRHGDPKILFFDEPTANLHHGEVHRLLKLMQTVASSGVTIVWVSHYLPEVMAIADRATIMRNGCVVATRAIADTSANELTALLVGESIVNQPATEEARHPGAPAITAAQLSGEGVETFDLEIRAGEIVGVAGLPGSGRDLIGPMIFGASSRSGSVQIGGRTLKAGRPWQSLRLGAVYVPADRHGDAAFLEHSAEANITIARPRDHVTSGIIRPRLARLSAARWMNRLTARPADPRRQMDKFSGGNQQKIILARALAQNPRFLILDNPTQGVDVHARAEIHQLISRAAADGLAVLVASSDHEELAAMCDRVLVMKAGVVASTVSTPELSAQSLTRATQA